MNSEPSYEDILISRVLSGEADAAEKQELEKWIALSPVNRKYFEDASKIFNDAVPANVSGLDVDKAWSKLNEKINSTGARVIPLTGKQMMLRVAAAVLFIFTVSVLVYRNYFTMPEPELAVNAGARAISKTLPDGSNVTVNKNSSIAFLHKNGKRVVQLKGEAYFEVKHDASEPFEVLVKDAIIEDIGTAFNVNESEDGQLVTVTVNEGEVRFYREGEQGLSLLKGEQAVYNTGTKKFRQVVPESSANTGSYASLVLVFRETPLKEVIRQVNEVYGSDIRLRDEKTGNCSVTVLFNHEQLDIIVSVICETLDLSRENKGKVIWLNGESCQ